MTACRTLAEVTAAAIEDAAREDRPLTQEQSDFWHALVAPYRRQPGPAAAPEHEAVPVTRGEAA